MLLTAEPKGKVNSNITTICGHCSICSYSVYSTCIVCLCGGALCHWCNLMVCGNGHLLTEIVLDKMRVGVAVLSTGVMVLPD